MRTTRAIPALSGITVVLIVVAALVTSAGTPANSAVEAYTLVSTSMPSAPVLDGTVDSLWSEAPSLSIPISGGWAGSISVSMKSVYSGGNVYFLIQYSDAENSDRRAPWHKNEDGSWSRIPAKTPGYTSWTTKDPNAAYEDKMAIIWNINDSIAGFNDSGCAVLCHWSEPPQPRKYSNAPGEIGDMWHFKSVRTAPVGQTDDQYVDDCTNVATCAEYGRHPDPKLSGGYSNNYTGSSTAPIYTSPTQPAPPYYLLNSEKQTFTDTYSAGDEIAAIIISTITGDRGQLSTGSNYNDSSDTWTLEIGRPLVTPSQTDPETPSPYDIQFDDLDGEYHFGVGVFDNAQIEHSYSSGAYKMIFAECSEPNLSLSLDGVTWVNYTNYLNRLLTVNMEVNNTGAADAYEVEISGTVNNAGGVTTPGPLPALGDIPAGGGVAFGLQYNVPVGVGSFMTTVNAQAEDACGNSYSYPS